MDKSLTRLSGNVLADLYIRIRAEVDEGEYDPDPNHMVRAAIAMAIFNASEAIGADIFAIEARVREELGQLLQTLAA